MREGGKEGGKGEEEEQGQVSEWVSTEEEVR